MRRRRHSHSSREANFTGFLIWQPESEEHPVNIEIDDFGYTTCMRDIEKDRQTLSPEKWEVKKVTVDGID